MPRPANPANASAMLAGSRTDAVLATGSSPGASEDGNSVRGSGRRERPRGTGRADTGARVAIVQATNAATRLSAAATTWVRWRPIAGTSATSVSTQPAAA